MKNKNHNIKNCEKCESTELFQDDFFGSFPILDNPNIRVNLTTIDRNNSIIFLLVSTAFFLILIFAFWNSFWINFVIERYIAKPLREIANRLKNDEPLDGVENIIEEIGLLLNRIKTWREERKSIEIGKIARLLAHDIRSPLMALESMADRFGNKNKNAKDLHKIIERISDIANSFLNLSKSKDSDLLANAKDISELSVNLLFPLIDRVVAEKRAQLKKSKIIIKFDVSANARFACVRVNGSSFMRVISNVLDNAIEALCGNNGKINIELSVANNILQLEIVDNGCGIAKDNLKHIFDEGFTRDKAAGNGLGLFYARNVIASLDGNISAFSKVGVGTSIKIDLPLVTIAPWLTDNCVVQESICLIDDERDALIIFKKLLKSKKLDDVPIHYFERPENFLKNKDEFRVATIFIDNYFKNSFLSGVDIVSKLTERSRVYLVTNDYDSSELINNVLRLGIKMIPKPCLAQVKIKKVYSEE